MSTYWSTLFNYSSRKGMEIQRSPGIVIAVQGRVSLAATNWRSSSDDIMTNTNLIETLKVELFSLYAVDTTYTAKNSQLLYNCDVTLLLKCKGQSILACSAKNPLSRLNQAREMVRHIDDHDP